MQLTQLDLRRFLTADRNAEEDAWAEVLRSPISDLEGKGISLTLDELVPDKGGWLCRGPGVDVAHAYREGDWVRVGPVTDAKLYGEWLGDDRGFGGPSTCAAVVTELLETTESSRWRVRPLFGGRALPSASALRIGPTEPLLDVYNQARAPIQSGWPVVASVLGSAPVLKPEWLDQEDAQRRCLATLGTAGGQPVSLLLGPPGTGKSYVVARTAEILAAQASVVVCALSHRALDAVMGELVELAPVRPVFRRGPQTAWTEHHGVRCVKAAVPAPAGAITLTTFHGLLHDLADCVAVPDAILVDEASQLSLPFLCALIATGARVLLAGDPQQLGPVSKQASPDPHLLDGLTYLQPRVPTYAIRHTRRMNRHVCRPPSLAFYDGQLEPTAEQRNALLRVRTDGSPLGNLAASEGQVLVAVPEEQPDERTSPAQARLVATLVAYLERNAVAPGQGPLSFGVSCPYRAQVRELRRQLRARLGPGYVPSRMVVDTVERMQGQTVDVSVYSVPSSDDPPVRGWDWLLSPRRLNVAVTRGRFKSFVLASPKIGLRLSALLRGMTTDVGFDGPAAFPVYAPKEAIPSDSAQFGG